MSASEGAGGEEVQGVTNEAVSKRIPEAQINLAKSDIDLIIQELMKGYLAGRMDNVTYYDLHGRLFRGYFQIARIDAERQIKAEGLFRRRKR